MADEVDAGASTRYDEARHTTKGDLQEGHAGA